MTSQTPNQKSEQQPPNQESEQQPPNQESEQQPPNQESEQQPPDQESEQQPPNQESEQGGKFSNFFEFLHFLLTDKRGIRISKFLFRFLLGFLGLVTLILGLVTYVAIKHMSPKEIELETKLGAISIKKGNTEKIVFLLSPNGGNGSPWIDTGIEVKEGDLIEIKASGKVSTSIKRVVASTLNPEVDQRNWVDPRGIIRSDDNIIFNELYDEAKVLPGKGFGTLLAAIKSSEDNEKIKPEKIIAFSEGDESINFTAKNNGKGKLVLTVNDIWLHLAKKDTTNLYAPPDNEDYKDHYLQLAEWEAAFNQEDFNSWSEETQAKKAEEQYQKRLKGWKAIKKGGHESLWYDDNIGSFSVSITVNSKAK